MFDGVLILGKELRWAPERARRELKARAAAASAALRAGSEYIATLETRLKGQQEEGSSIVSGYLSDLGVDPAKVLLLEQTRSTREEALVGTKLAQEHGTRHLLVITAPYHVPRARRYFQELKGLDVAVHAPTALLRQASPQERAWILAGQPDPSAMRIECLVEALLSAAARALKPLPSSARWKLEVIAGAALRDDK